MSSSNRCRPIQPILVGLGFCRRYVCGQGCWCVLRGFRSHLALWRLLSREGLWHYQRFPVSDQAIYNRLAADDGHSMQWLFGGRSRTK